MKDKVKAALAGLSPGSALVCAVSGGADSVALLHCLWTLSEELALVIDSPELASILESHVDGIDEGAVLVTLSDAERMKREDGSFLAYLFTYFGG